MPEYEYKTEILTSMVGRDKLRLDDLDDTLRKYGREGWELVSVNLDADLKGSRDGHLLIFKRAKNPGGQSDAQARRSEDSVRRA